MDSTELKELLKGTPAFAILSDDELERFGEHFELAHYMLGQAVVRAGEESDSFYVVYSGRARVIADTRTGEEVTVGTLTRGNCFGEQGLLTKSPRNFTVRAAQTWMSPRRIAYRVRPAVEWMSSLSITLTRCVSAVFAATPRISAISFVVLPSATSYRT